MMEELVGVLLGLLGVYLLVGLLFAVPFVLRGAKAIDPSAAEGTWGFKLLVVPGVMVFWPVLLRRWMRTEGAPEERSAHRNGGKG